MERNPLRCDLCHIDLFGVAWSNLTTFPLPKGHAMLFKNVEMIVDAQVYVLATRVTPERAAKLKAEMVSSGFSWETIGIVPEGFSLAGLPARLRRAACAGRLPRR